MAALLPPLTLFFEQTNSQAILVMTKKYHGVIVPLLTPINAHGQIDFPSVEKLFDFTLKPGNFPFVLGTTGEMAFVSTASREKFVKYTANHLGSKTTFYAAVSDNSLDNSITAAKKYVDYGVDALVAHLPYFLPIDPDAMMSYFEALADNAPAPIIIYNIASITHMSIPVEVIEKLSQHPNIAGLKDSERDWARIEQLTALFKDREDFSLFIGWTDKSTESLAIGFDGIIPNTANVAPSLFQDLYQAAVGGDIERAIALQTTAGEIGKLVQAGKTMTTTIPELKAITKYLGVCDQHVLPPLVAKEGPEAEALINKFLAIKL